MLSKQIAFDAVRKELNERTARVQTAFDDLKNSLNSESKSTAGDKHETGRAMAQLEQEKLSNQLIQIMTLKETLSKVDPTEHHKLIQYGSLVNTNNGTFFFSVGLGKLTINDYDVFCITATTPLGQLLIGKRKGDTVKMNGRAMKILDIL
ncbi:MAG: 3-oxoacyl-ACP synthase [Crocinitomicaceae bacterium]|nr:3-oxoacyl-ACP synthase [Crocinitomicaceae bacterium]MDG1776917.1 3-oxoacyl-ACP synthase [Crocinitomicaceae bacterium]